jgi:hypothetical protein
LKTEREKKKKPYTILPEKEFHELLQKKLDTEFFWGTSGIYFSPEILFQGARRIGKKSRSPTCWFFFLF